jgi:hypothetical protein
MGVACVFSLWSTTALIADTSISGIRVARELDHGSRSMWIATPSSYRTCTDYSLPISRRTAKHSVRHRGRTLRMKCTRQRCQEACSTLPTAALMPS